MPLYNPLAAPTEAFLQFYNMLPLPFRNLVSISFYCILALTIVAIAWKVKH